ncbi:hypothetical protein BD289DRAFT_144004 [Coniella lustricola]|uniref:Uncharacterized protein n=1 Tax=Coniella lustricola TaxID=2025994 RepID=A0A2T3AEW9_9PEZI|nr:hypothetical protein BD289DRAFT_144004 [Coniella lustricola]
MASSGEGIEVAALRKRIEYGLTMLGKEVNASTRERMKNAIQADRDRLKRLETDQVLRKPQRIVPVRLESKVWEVIEEASRSHYQDDEQQGDDSAANDSNSFPFHPPQPRRRERYASRPSTPETPWIPHKEDDETRRAQIIAEHQRRREVLLAQLSPEPASSKQPTAEERRRAEDAERRKREQARLDLKTPSK